MERQIPRLEARQRLSRAYATALGAGIVLAGGDNPAVKRELRDLVSAAEPTTKGRTGQR